MRIKFLALILFNLLITPICKAHSPYLIKIQTMTTPNGEPVILEWLYGDGIFGPNPVRLQLRNKQDAVIAYSSTGSHVSVFCPTLQHC